MQLSIQDIKEALAKSAYVSNQRINYTLYATNICKKPLLIEGAPGVGKTSLAKSLAKGLGIPFIRVQMYEGLTADQILYDYDYQRQLLTLEAIRPVLDREFSGLSAQDALKKAVQNIDFYGEEFLIKRPVLRSIMTPGPKVLLFDEIDKAPEEVEYMLYEFLEENSISIPQYGEIQCREEDRPLVFLTSNGYRELSGAMKRRCNYLYIDRKKRDEIVAILTTKVNIDPKLADGIAKCLVELQIAQLRQSPSISEAIEFAEFLSKDKQITKEMVLGALGMLIKNNKDESVARDIITKNGELLWTEQTET